MRSIIFGKRTLLLLFISCVFTVVVYSRENQKQQEFYEIKIYHLKNAEQEKVIDEYLRQAFLPALHKIGISKVGVFKPLTNDTAADKRIYVFMPAATLEQFVKLPELLEKDAEYLRAAKTYLEADYANAPYTRIETILLRAFPLAPQMEVPKLSSPHAEHIFELRSYEGATEKLYANKVQMFNKGGEIALFKRLNFNAVFYAEVISGCHMPNLMYMTSFENKTVRDELWKTFGNDPEWKKLSSMPEYQHNVSKADIILMHPAAYSDL